MNNWIILTFLLLSSCKAAKPELISLLGQGQFGSNQPVPSNSGKGQGVVGADLKSSTSFRIRSRVAITPQPSSMTSTSFHVRSNVRL